MTVETLICRRELSLLPELNENKTFTSVPVPYYTNFEFVTNTRNSMMRNHYLVIAA